LIASVSEQGKQGLLSHFIWHQVIKPSNIFHGLELQKPMAIPQTSTPFIPCRHRKPPPIRFTGPNLPANHGTVSCSAISRYRQKAFAN
jgi:hypothetical protein